MRKRATDQAGENQKEGRPYRVRLPGFITEEDVGLGDAIARVSRTVGIRPCGACARRAAAWNRWVVFTGRAR